MSQHTPESPEMNPQAERVLNERIAEALRQRRAMSARDASKPVLVRTADSPTWQVGGARILRSDDAARATVTRGEVLDRHLQELLREWRDHHGHVRPSTRTPQEIAGDALADVLAPPSAVTNELKDHDFDGIQEYDNPTPGWWYGIFAATVVFSAIYWLVIHHTSIIPDRYTRLASAEEKAVRAQFAGLMALPEGEDKIRQIMGNSDWLRQGAALYLEKKCDSCHGRHGQGMIGPNFYDQQYVNVQTLMDIPQVIREGVPQKGMPPQANMFNEQELALVTAYVASLRGRQVPPDANPAPKAPQGVEIPPFPEPILAGG